MSYTDRTLSLVRVLAGLPYHSSARCGRQYPPILRTATIYFALIFLAFGSFCGAATVVSTYDDLNRLTRVDYGNGDYIQYTYDEVGNRTAMQAYQIARLTAIEAAKAASDNRAVDFSGYVVTAAFQDFFYIERNDRSSGIRVEREKHGLTIGQKAGVEGAIRTNANGERFIDADLVSLSGSGSVKPLAMPNRAIGGGDWKYDLDNGSGQRGATGISGLNNVGLLVRTTGRVSFVDPAGQFFTISDGSSVQDQDGNAGVRVLAEGLTLPSVGDSAIVTGVVSLGKSGGVFHSLIRAREQGDIQAVLTGTISGRITASGGGPAVGATVTLTPGGRTATTNDTGDYAITGLASGTYTVTPSQTGYTFTPPSQPATITGGGAVAGIDFTRQVIQGKSISGTAVRRNIQQTAQMLDSPHPYPQNFSDVQFVTGPTGALALGAHFRLINLEPGHAFLRTYISGGALVQTFGQAYYSNVWSDWVSGNTIQLQLNTDWALQHWGYQMDEYRALMDGGPASGVLMTLDPGGRTTTTGLDGAYGFTGVLPGSYTVTAGESGHVLSPPTIPVAMGGSDVTGIDFASYVYGGVTGTVRYGGVGEGAIVAESPHPYQNYYIYPGGIDVPSDYIAIRAHFTQIATAPTYDYLYVRDGDGKFVQDLSGPTRYNVWSDWVPGYRIRFQLITDGADTAYGYQVDKIQAQYANGLAAGVTLTLTPGGLSTTTGSGGSFLFSSVPPGSYVITPSQTGYLFEPLSLQIQIDTGMISDAVDFLRY